MSHTMKCGIDFGTSNTTMAVISDDQSRLVPLEGHHLTIPTAIFYTEKTKRFYLVARLFPPIWTDRKGALCAV